jgi:hypothetical protein
VAGTPCGLTIRYQIRVIDESAIRLRYEKLASMLDERGRRRFGAAEAMAAGRGGIRHSLRVVDVLSRIKSVVAGISRAAAASTNSVNVPIGRRRAAGKVSSPC